MKHSLKLSKAIYLILLTFSLTSCLNSVEESSVVEDDNKPDPCENITFSTNVKPIIDANCIQCHGVGGNFPNLTTLSNIQGNASLVKSVVVSRRMPIGGSLTQDQINAIACWVDGGSLDN